MQIADNVVASLRYKLTDSQGEILDEATQAEPFVYLHGANNIIPGLESALIGKLTDDQLEVTIPPEDAYGVHDKRLTEEVSKAMFSDVPDTQLVPGAQFHAQTNAGQEIITIAAVQDETVTIDGNHPLAGETLHFDVTVLDVRAATEEEMSHGHAHDAHGDCGHEY